MSDIRLVQEWLVYAKNDLISSRHLFYDIYPKQFEIACYHSQQCAEKALKGYLLYKDLEPPWTHNLVELCQICMQHDDTFLQILEACSDLTPYGVAACYPNELAVDDIITKSTIDKANAVYNFVSARIS